MFTLKNIILLCSISFSLLGIAMGLSAYLNYNQLALPNRGSSANATIGSDTLTEIDLIFVGDIMGHTPQIKSAEIKKDSIFDYKPCFQYVKSIISDCDYAIGNLELTLPGKPPYTGYPTFKSPDALAVALKDAGFDFLTTCNNHANDSRARGVIATINTLDRLMIDHTGTFVDSTHRDSLYPFIKTVKGVKIAFLNYTYDTNGIPTQAPTIVNLIDTTQMLIDINKAKREKPDVILAIMHWGLEYQLNESEEQRKYAAWLAKNGVHAIIGSHPHVVQPIKNEILDKKDSTLYKLPIVYSMGNFISNQTPANTDGGIMVKLKINKNNITGVTTINDCSYIPVWRYIRNGANNKKTYQVIPVSTYELDNGASLSLNEINASAMKKFASNTRGRLAKNGAQEMSLTKTPIKKPKIRTVTSSKTTK